MLPSELEIHITNGVLANGTVQKSPSSSPWPSPLLPDSPLPLPELCSRAHDRISSFLEQEVQADALKSVQNQTRISLGVIQDALARFDLSELSISYNGGKDCLVLLILYLAALHNHPHLCHPSQLQPSLQSVYIESTYPFSEVEQFVSFSSKICSLSLTHYAKPMKASFTEYLQDFPKVKGIFVGTRRTDPHGGQLTHFDPTDHGWPKFMRIHPVIDWHYVDIWTFIRHLNIPYCALYDKGYTSLGGTNDTHRNPALRRSSMSSSGRTEYSFRPAYELIEDEEERLGRETKEYHPRTPTEGEVMAQTVTPPRSIPNESAIVDDDISSI